jgi:hypothetical protein
MDGRQSGKGKRPVRAGVERGLGSVSLKATGAPSAGNLAKVKLDLNDPNFQSELFALDANEIRRVFKTLQKINTLTWSEVFTDHGLKWDAVKSLAGKYTIRLSQSYRAVATRDAAFMRLQSLHGDHDSTYGKK